MYMYTYNIYIYIERERERLRDTCDDNIFEGHVLLSLALPRSPRSVEYMCIYIYIYSTARSPRSEGPAATRFGVTPFVALPRSEDTTCEWVAPDGECS